MRGVDINLIPKYILKELAVLEEVSMFILPNGYIISGKYLNDWESTLKDKLYKIYERHGVYVNIEITTFSLASKKIEQKNLVIDVKHLTKLLMSYLVKNISVSIIINNYHNRYGYLIIPGEQFKRDKVNIYNM